MKDIVRLLREGCADCKGAKKDGEDIEADDDKPVLKEKDKKPVKESILARMEALAGAYPTGVSGGDHYRGIIIEQAARTFFVCAWADAMEEAGERAAGPGEDLMDAAPPTTPDALKFAKDWAHRVEQKNKLTLVGLLQKAMEADSEEWPPDADYAEQFGHYLAMESLGHGVSWTDDHEDFDYKVPHCEFYMHDIESQDCDGSLGG